MSNVVTPSVLLAALGEADVAYPPPNPPPPEPPAAPPPPSPPPGAIRCQFAAVPTTRDRKSLQLTDRSNMDRELLDTQCWHWSPEDDWPPFVVHRDAYESVERCGGARSRTVQWEGGFRQPLISSDAFDPDHRNSDECPFEERREQQLSGASLDDVPIELLRQGKHCRDGSQSTNNGVSNFIEGERDVCELGTQKRSCGIHEHLVIFGYAAFHNSYDALATSHHQSGHCTDRTTGMRLTGKTFCDDGGPGSVSAPESAECFYGTQPNECGVRSFAFLPEDAGPDVPDDSCATSKNGVCEDGLMWSVWPPNYDKTKRCDPNTDMCFEYKLERSHARTHARAHARTRAQDRLWVAPSEAPQPHWHGRLGHVPLRVQHGCRPGRRRRHMPERVRRLFGRRVPVLSKGRASVTVHRIGRHRPHGLQSRQPKPHVRPGHADAPLPRRRDE